MLMTLVVVLMMPIADDDAVFRKADYADADCTPLPGAGC